MLLDDYDYDADRAVYGDDFIPDEYFHDEGRLEVYEDFYIYDEDSNVYPC